MAKEAVAEMKTEKWLKIFFLDALHKVGAAQPQNYHRNKIHSRLKNLSMIQIYPKQTPRAVPAVQPDLHIGAPETNPVV